MKFHILISLFLTFFIICSCSSNEDEVQSTSLVKIYVGDYPAPITDGLQTRTVTDSEGNVSWTDGDEILLSIKSTNTAQYVTLSYKDGVWTPDMYIKPLASANITAYFAPTYQWNNSGMLEVKIGKSAGADEYIIYRNDNVDISTGGIYINFSDQGSARTYSRLRVYMGAKFVGGSLSLDGMIPAGADGVETITSPIQSNGCAYFYGTFEGNETLTYTFEGSTTTKTTPASGSVNGKGYFNNLSAIVSLQYVDLGLSSGNKWANCNLDAPSSTLSGGYYAWGATEPSVEFVNTDGGFISQPTGESSGSSITNTITYTDTYLGSKSLKFPLTSDAANIKWGTNWHVPTCGDWKELEKSCTWTWTICNNVKGYKITGSNGNSIFLPAVGYYAGTSLKYSGTGAMYQCSTVSSSAQGMVYSYFFSEDSKYVNTNPTSRGLSIRPVYSE